jgi:hypothetical protein
MRRSTPWASDLAGAALSMGTCRGGTVPFSVLGMDVRAVRFLIEHGVYHRLNCPISGQKWDSLNACSQPARRGSGGDPDSADRRLPADGGGTGVDARSSPTKVEILDGQVYPQPVCQTARHAYMWSPTSTAVRDPRRPSDVVVELVRDRSAGGCHDTAGHLIRTPAEGVGRDSRRLGLRIR